MEETVKNILNNINKFKNLRHLGIGYQFFNEYHVVLLVNPGWKIVKNYLKIKSVDDFQLQGSKEGVEELIFKIQNVDTLQATHSKIHSLMGSLVERLPIKEDPDNLEEKIYNNNQSNELQIDLDLFRKTLVLFYRGDERAVVLAKVFWGEEEPRYTGDYEQFEHLFNLLN